MVNEGLIKRVAKDCENRDAAGNQYVEHIIHLLKGDERITPKVFNLAMRRAGCTLLTDTYTLKFLYLELLKFTTEADKGVPTLVKEADDKLLINKTAKQYRLMHPKPKQTLMIMDELAHATVLPLSQ